MNPFSQSRHADSISQGNLVELIDSYIEFYATSSGHTARAKKLDLYHFVRFLTDFRKKKSQESLLVKDWDYSAVQAFVENCLRAGESPATVTRRLATLKHMGRTLSEKYSGFINPAREVKPPKTAPLRPKSLTDDEIETIRAFAQEKIRLKPSFTRQRNFILFNFLLDTGLRAEEIRLLKGAQIKADLHWIEGVRTKGRKFRNVYITTTVREDLKTYLALREKQLKKYYPTLTAKVLSDHPLFISTHNAVPGKPQSFYLDPKTIWRAIRDFSQGTKLHPHLLRHSFAIDLLEDSKDIRLVSQALGHSDVRITMRYTERRDEEIAEALEAARKR
jgi:site-specific recombinase XerD